MVKEGFPYVLIPAVLALLFAYFQLWAVAGLLAALAAFMAFFFRDPYRNVPEGDDIIVSAADGKVTRITEDEKGKLVSVFLSPLDVHVNRSPIAGVIEKAEFTAGRKVPATRGDASLVNERNSLTIRGKQITVVCTQIAGILARRIVCWNVQGDELALGQRFGLIKFSSRTDVLMPSEVEILVRVGDRVVGGETIIGRFTETAD
jgi:phosphatidylserine decarboxylase